MDETEARIRMAIATYFEQRVEEVLESQPSLLSGLVAKIAAIMRSEVEPDDVKNFLTSKLTIEYWMRSRVQYEETFGPGSRHMDFIEREGDDTERRDYPGYYQAVLGGALRRDNVVNSLVKIAGTANIERATEPDNIRRAVREEFRWSYDFQSSAYSLVKEGERLAFVADGLVGDEGQALLAEQRKKEETCMTPLIEAYDLILTKIADELYAQP